MRDDRYLIECNDVLDALRDVARNTYHGVLCDPPYGLQFMGKRWDHGVPSCEVWREVLRVVKPGGMLLAFGGTRTFHRLMCNIEDAGWEIRDTLMYVYGTGFPKSYDISKGIDKLRMEDRAPTLEVCRWFVDNLERLGLTAGDVNKHFGSANIAQQWTTTHNNGVVQPRVPSIEQWAELRRWLELDGTMDEEVFRLNRRKGKPGDNFRYESDKAKGVGFMNEDDDGWNTTVNRLTRVGAASSSAQQWNGYGTALKPSYEPIVLAMKPIEGGFANNALEWGVGGLNVDGCRVEARNKRVRTLLDKGNLIGTRGGVDRPTDRRIADKDRTITKEYSGRWPANLILSYPEDQYSLRHGNLSSSQLDELEIWFIDNDIDQDALGGDDPVLTWEYEKLPDELKGMFIECDNDGEREVLSGFPNVKGPGFYKRPSGDSNTRERNASSYELDDKGERRRIARFSGQDGSASRFFYHAKTSSRERHLGNINCRHPTLKPIRLTHYLAKLILPPPHINSKLLIPFSGAGSEVIGGLKAGWGYVHGIDNDSQYCDWANARIIAALECEGFNWPAIPRKPREPDIATFDPATMNILDYLRD